MHYNPYSSTYTFEHDYDHLSLKRQLIPITKGQGYLQVMITIIGKWKNDKLGC